MHVGTATADPDGSADHPLSEVAGLLESYRQMPMAASRYVTLVVIPSVIVFVATVLAAWLLSLPLSIRLPLPLLGGLVFGTAILYPKILINNRRHEIENKFHLLITHMTVLSATNIDRMAVFRTLAEEDEYGQLAVEIRRVVEYVDTWNRSLDDACRRRAKAVPSKPLANFLERLAYTIGAGQELNDFLLSEQSVMIQNYVTVYESALDNLEVLKDLYLSMILSMTFALVFAIVLPILTGTSPVLTVAAVIVLYAFVQVGFYLAVRSMVPHDPVWYFPEGMTPTGERRLLASIVVGAGGSVLLVVAVAMELFGLGPIKPFSVLPGPEIPEPIFVAIPMTPLLIPGIVFRISEQRIIERDKEFPSFIRALGASESAKQSTTTAVLSTLRGKDFGALSGDIDNLYRRLNMRLDQSTAWRFFAADSRSYLIQKFSEMYLVGRQMGGDPKQLGELISENMSEVNQLREQRKQSTVTMIGLLYGITAASAFAFFIALEIVTILSNMTIDIDPGVVGSQLIYTDTYDIPLIRYLLYIVILFNSLLSALKIRTIDGGNLTNATIHFVLLTWIACVTGVVTTTIVGTFLSI